MKAGVARIPMRSFVSFSADGRNRFSLVGRSRFMESLLFKRNERGLKELPPLLSLMSPAKALVKDIFICPPNCRYTSVHALASIRPRNSDSS
jgi:hypothetical protein